MRRCLQIFHGLEFNVKQLLDPNLHFKAGCTFAGAAEIFGNGVPGLNSSTSRWTGIKMLSAGRKLRDQYQVHDLYTNTTI